MYVCVTLQFYHPDPTCGCTVILFFFYSQEVIMMLDQCRRDFSALIDRINVQDAFEKADYKDRYWKLNVLPS